MASVNMVQGFYKLWPVDAGSKLLDFPEDEAARARAITPDPSRPEAVDIYFGVRRDLAPPPPTDQVRLVDGVQRVLRAIRILYPIEEFSSNERVRTQFRSYYVRLYRAAQLGLEGDNVSPGISMDVLAAITSDLIDDEGGHVKNRHLRTLGLHAFCLMVPGIVLYLGLSSVSAYWPAATRILRRIDVDPGLLANFMVLLAGCFLGVWLSYGIRTTKLTLSDLTVTDSDRMTPLVRLLFAASLTMIVGLLLALDLVQVKIGTHEVTNLTHDTMFAFLVGCLCGVSELVLPTEVAKRAGDLFRGMK